MSRLSNPASAFERNPRRKQELRGRPFADRIYLTLFGEATEIKRAEREEALVLDMQHAIDVTLTLPTGMVATGQEKFLDYHLDTVTVEFMNDPRTGAPGDWFHLASQFYFVGYFNSGRTGFRTWIMLDWLVVALATLNGEINWQDNRNKDGRARASFKYAPFSQFKGSMVIAKA